MRYSILVDMLLKRIDLKEEIKSNEKRDQIEMSLVSVRASSSRYVQSTGDGARIILAHLFLVHKLENRDQLCGRARAVRLTTLGGTSPRGVSPPRQATSQTQPKTPTPGIFLISGNT